MSDTEILKQILDETKKRNTLCEAHASMLLRHERELNGNPDVSPATTGVCEDVRQLKRTINFIGASVPIFGSFIAWLTTHADKLPKGGH
jgi:hypothetical protein